MPCTTPPVTSGSSACTLRSTRFVAIHFAGHDRYVSSMLNENEAGGRNGRAGVACLSVNVMTGSIKPLPFP